MNSSVVIVLLVLLLLPNALTQTKSITGATGPSTDKKSTSETKSCTATGPQPVSFRLYSTQFYISAKNVYFKRCLFLQVGNQSPDQIFIASQDTDCIWTFMTFDGQYVSYDSQLACVTVVNQTSLITEFNLVQGQNWLSVRSASRPEKTWARNQANFIVFHPSPAKFVMELHQEN